MFELKLLAYLRVSTRGQVDAYGLPVQRKIIIAWAKAHGHKIVRFEVEEGVTGTVDENGRPALLAVLRSIKAHEADGFAVAEIGRLARELHIQEAILAQAWHLGGKVFCADDKTGDGEVLQDDPEDPMRTAMRQMAGVFMQLERALINKRLRNGRAEKARQGGYAYGSPRFGTQARDKQLMPDDAELAVVARIRQLEAAGLSRREIAAQLNAQGIPSKRGGTWSHITVGRVLGREGSSS